MPEKQYAERNIELMEQFYTRHVAAMTDEGLHSKTAIAAELAHRDIIIVALHDRLESLMRAANVGDNAFSEKYSHLSGLND